MALVIVIIYKEEEKSQVIAVLFQYLMNFQGLQKHLVGCIASLQRQFISVGRCFKLYEIPQEKEESKMETCTCKSQNWPQQGNVTFNDVKLRYRPKTDLVLKGLNFDIQGGHKVGIVGRTGAGKSTMSLALSRIIELESGNI